MGPRNLPRRRNAPYVHKTLLPPRKTNNTLRDYIDDVLQKRHVLLEVSYPVVFAPKKISKLLLVVAFHV